MNGLALCAGVGGLDLGLRLALGSRFRSVVYVEREAYAAAALVARMEDAALDPAPVWDDLVTFDGRPWRGVVDLVTAGFPCQPWSVAGQRKGTADERWLWPDIVRIIREVDPRLVFLENVPGLLRHGLSIVLEDLASLGFDAEWDSFRAGELGAPHKRERLFILAHAAVEREREPHDEASADARTRARAHPGGERRGVADPERARRGRNGSEPERHDGRPTLAGPRPTGCDSGVADSDISTVWDESGRRHGAGGPGAPEPRHSGAAGVADADLDGLEGERSGRLFHGERAPQRDDPHGRRLPPFPPGPGDAAGWARILAVRPDLAPALGNASLDGARKPPARSPSRRAAREPGRSEAEPVLRGLADGMAPRVERLRAAGNGVVPIVAGYAFLALAERLGVEVTAGCSDTVNRAFFFVNTEPQEDRK